MRRLSTAILRSHELADVAVANGQESIPTLLVCVADGGSYVEPSHGPTVTINQSYLYAIRDRGAGTVLFIGRVTDPTIAA